MSALAAIAALCGAGLALLHLSRLSTGRPAVDLPLGWFIGQAWFGLGAYALRFLLGVPYGAPTALLLVAAPPLALLTSRWRRRGEGPPPADMLRPARWRPRPAWLYGAMGAYAALVTLAVVLHAIATPTSSDDGLRVRAYAPVLALRDDWSAAARSVLHMAGPIPTWVPTLAWTVTGSLEHLHTQVVVLADLVALLVLAVGLAAARGRPERGLLGAFLACSLPLFVFHLTTSLADAPLAIHVAVGLLLAAEFAREGDPDDAVRAMLAYASAAMVKREGLVVAGAAAVVLLASALARPDRPRRLLARLLLAASPVALLLAANAAAVGAAGAIPLLQLVLGRATDGGVQAALSPAPAVASAPRAFAEGLFSLHNHGLVFWILPVAVAVRARQALRGWLAWPLAVVALLFLESLAGALWLTPIYTADGTTVHRSLLPAALAASFCLAGLLAEPEPVNVDSGGAGSTSTDPAGTG
jgi:hypothetical protein